MKEARDIAIILEEVHRNTPWYRKCHYWYCRVYSDLRYFIVNRVPCFFHRGRKGYSYIDTWGFDSYLCGVISGGLKILKENLHGAPPDLFDDNAENPTWPWEVVLDKIIEGLEAGSTLISGDFMELHDTPEDWKPKEEVLRRKFNLGMRLFRRHFFSLWD